MTISVRFFASLSEQTGIKQTTVETDTPVSMAEIWSRVTDQPPPDNLLCARNQQYAAFGDMVRAGDEVAFFPPVNGG